MKTSIVIALSFVAFAACSKKSSEGGGAAKTESGDKAAPAAKLSFKKIGALGIEAEVPEDANIEDNTKGAGYPSATVYASPTAFISGGGEMSDVKPTIEETKARMQKEEKSLQPGREDKTADGWIIEMKGKSIMGDEITAVMVRRTIDGKPFDCHSNVRGKDEVEKLEKMCASIRAAK